MYVLNDKRINIDAQFEDEDGNRYANLRDPQLRAQIGVTEIADPERKDERFYFAQEIDEAPYVVNAPKTLAVMRGHLLAQINASCETAMQEVKAGYPESEVLSWAKQEEEARAFMADELAATPLLDALATARGLDKSELASRVIAKADLFATVSGTVIGKRQALEDALAELPDEATIETHQAAIEAILQKL
jgi:hypothetical protein